MLVKSYSLSILITFFSLDLSNGYNYQLNHKITVIGTAVVMKHDAAVRTDDNLLYYLNGLNEWDDKIRGKRIKVTGRLVIKKYESKKSANPNITAIPQQRLDVWKIIMKPEWSLVK